MNLYNVFRGEMAAAIDLKIKRNSEKVYDLILATNGDFQTVDSFDTSIEMSLFNDKRASPSEIPIGSLRRGWWGNETSDTAGFEIGSKIWLLKQARLTQDTLNLAINYVKTALKWMITDGYAKKIEVAGQIVGNEGMQLNINFIRPNNIVVNKYYKLWNNTLGDIS